MTENEEFTVQRLAKRFLWQDYTVFAAVLSASAAIGFYYGFKSRKKNSASEMLLASKSMGTFPVAMSLLASFMSAVALLGVPAEVYKYGTMYWMICISYFLVMHSTASLYLPIFYNLKITSAYQYLELRFNKTVSFLGAATFMIQMCLYMAVVVYAPALALSQVTGVNKFLSCSIIFFVCILYTAMGGMKAVMWTDVLQVIVMLSAVIATILVSVHQQGGFNKVLLRAIQSERLEAFNFSVDPTERHTFWSLTIGGYFTWVAIYGVNQAMVQRYLSVPDLKKAQKALYLNSYGLTTLVTVCVLVGLCIYSKYHDCDPLSTGVATNSEQLYPLFVMETMTNVPGFAGLFVAGIFSGALSTVSSGINALAAVMLEDFIKYFYSPMSGTLETALSKGMTVIFGLICFGLIFIAALLGSVLQAALSIFGMVGGPLLGIFTLGIFFPWANSTGAIAGAVVSLVSSFWIGFGAQIVKSKGELVFPKKNVSVEGCLYNFTLIQSFTPPIHEQHLGIFKVSYLWYSAIGCWTVVGIGLICSYLTGPNDPRTLDPRLICNLSETVFRHFPKAVKQLFDFQVGKLYEGKRGVEDPYTGLHMNTTELDLVTTDEIGLKRRDSESSFININFPAS